MKVFIGGIGTETNTFAPIPTGRETFDERSCFHGDATQHPASLFSEPLHVWRRMSEERQGQVVEGICAFAQPGGNTARAVYEDLRDELLRDLGAALPVDLVLLNMHGAMVADGYDDCEGDMLVHVRELVGAETIVGVELDLHCHITQTMLDHADAIVTYKEYPHIDAPERAGELFEICEAAWRGDAKPVMALYDCRMISMWRTPVEPVKSFVARLHELEGRDGVLSVSFGHGFPWGDVADVGAKMLVISDGDTAKAAALAEKLGQELWRMRDESVTEMASLEEAVERMAAVTNGPLVLADVADNAGGGAASDSTFLLRAVVDAGISGVLSGFYWDPVAVRFCKEAGEGGRLQLRIGGKCGPASGDPVDLEVEVVRIAEDVHQSFGSSKNAMGDAVWLRAANDLDLVLNTIRTQVFHPDAFTALGLDPAAKRSVIVKSTQHFYAGFAPLAEEVLYVAAAGAIAPDFADIPLSKRTTPYWPKVADPFI